MDFDRDGDLDVLSGSWPGPLYLFRRNSAGKFDASEELKDETGKVIDVGSGSAPFLVDWDGSGSPDLLVGNFLGELHFLANVAKEGEPRFAAGRRIEADGKPIAVTDGEAAPVAADWDGDGRLDLIVGAADGSVSWYRNSAAEGEPRLSAAQTLIGPSPIGWGDDTKWKAGQWGLRVKPCVVDFNGDGRLDLLLGDRCGGFEARPSQTDSEKQEEHAAARWLPDLRRQWAAIYQVYRQRLKASENASDRDQLEVRAELDALREKLRLLKDEIARAQEIELHYRPQYQTHGYIWLFVRKASMAAAPPRMTSKYALRLAPKAPVTRE